MDLADAWEKIVYSDRPPTPSHMPREDIVKMINTRLWFSLVDCADAFPRRMKLYRRTKRCEEETRRNESLARFNEKCRRVLWESYDVGLSPSTRTKKPTADDDVVAAERATE